jgi:hypothetical protein
MFLTLAVTGKSSGNEFFDSLDSQDLEDSEEKSHHLCRKIRTDM